MHPKEKTCSRGSINTTAQPKIHTLSHMYVFPQVIYLAPTGILHITVSTSLSHIHPIACKCFFLTKAASSYILHAIKPHTNAIFYTFNPVCHMGNRRRHVFESQRSLIDQDSRVVSVYCMSPSRLNPPPSPLHSQPEQRSQPDHAAERSQKCYRH